MRASPAVHSEGHGVMAAPYVNLDPEGVLILHQRARGESGEPAIDGSLWHIIDAERRLTWCGRFLSKTWERRPYSETPSDRRCETCVSRFESEVVRGPTD
jgi:hypothetical protein